MNEGSNKINYDEGLAVSILKILFLNKKIISIVTILLTLLFLFMIINMPNQYKSSALLKVNFPESPEGASSISRYSGIASIAGLSVPSVAEDKGQVAIETIKSRSFVKKLIEFDGVLEKLMATESYDPVTKEITFNEDIFDSKSGKWLEEKPTYLEVYRLYDRKMSISQDKSTGFISISFEHLSPIFAYEFTNLIIRELNRISRERDIKESNDALTYLEEQSLETKQTNIKLFINQMIENQLRTNMLSNIREEYSLMSIDPPFIPERKSSPSRAMLSIMAAMFSFFFSVFIVLVREILTSNKLRILKA
mgnify:CR=1 FL=1|tara:strand:+ start:69 stop:992 length:924 start_codon:yes stop_codon:yes gene_type:complete